MRPGSNLKDDEGSSPFDQVLSPLYHPLFLRICSGVLPHWITEHQDVGPQELSAPRTLRKRPLSLERFRIHLDLDVICIQDSHATTSGALNMVDGPMALHDPLRIETCFLEGTIDVTGEHEGGMLHLVCKPAENIEPCMGSRRPVQVEPMAIEPPGQRRIVLKPTRVSHVRESQTQVPVRRIGIPESLVPTEIG